MSVIDLPLYRLEPLALDDTTALVELSRRQTERLTTGTTEINIARVTKAYSDGFQAARGGLTEKENPFGHRNNFAATQRRAWRWGHQKYHQLVRLTTKHGEVPA